MVILKDARKRIGGGWSTRVWNDCWIPNTQTRRVISPRGQSSEDMVVVELFNERANGWNSMIIRQLFLPFEQERILNIRINESKPVDCLCWDLEKDGCYSVRSAYRILAGEDGVAA
ncbi:uncharacterized protein LOC141613808 [Silene latifolia]|uniref:uncharacterized protein LOC141613808 n=1 Tax=Silene latifolia TaxID=37657 RepID=UPI003D77DAB1